MNNSLMAARNRKNKTQADMAKMLGIGLSTYNMYENGQRKIPDFIVRNICLILDVKEDEIFLASTFTLRKIGREVAT